MKKFIMALPIWALAIVLVFFVVSNRHTVTVSLFPMEMFIDTPLYMVFFFGLFLGLFLAGFILLVRRVNAATNIYMAKRENSRLRSKVVDLEKAADENLANGNSEENNKIPLAKH